jgi:hypothetical protein
LNLLARKKLVPAAGEIEPLHIKNEPSVMGRARAEAAGKAASAIGSDQSICFHTHKIDMRKGKHDEAVD